MSNIIPGTDVIATLAGRVHPDYRRSGTKDLLYMTGGQRMITSFPQRKRILYDALKSQYWDKVIPASRDSSTTITLERQWVSLFQSLLWSRIRVLHGSLFSQYQISSSFLLY